MVESNLKTEEAENLNRKTLSFFDEKKYEHAEVSLN